MCVKAIMNITIARREYYKTYIYILKTQEFVMGKHHNI